MALADYFQRNAVAAAQVIAGFDEAAFQDQLSATHVGVSFGREAASTLEGRTLLDMAMRLLARLYPALEIRVASGADAMAAEMADLAQAINPRIDITEGNDTSVAIAVGADAPAFAPITFYAGSDGWDAYLGTTGPRAVGTSANPLGAGAAACFACANVFRAVFLDHTGSLFDHDSAFSVLDLSANATHEPLALEGMRLPDDAVLVGLGAIGNAAAWALARTQLSGRLHLVDQQEVDLSNLQRYTLARRMDEGRSKVTLVAEAFQRDLLVTQYPLPWAEFVERYGYVWPHVLVALDSARDRRAVQASLPGWIANAWTQPDDLGLSIHPFGGFGGLGACLHCLYLPSEALASEDVLVARALGVPEQLMQIRELLYRDAPAPRPLLEMIANKLEIPLEHLLAFEDRPIRTLYVEGMCAGAVLPLGRLGTPQRDMHVPLAHQSALAGVLLAGALARQAVQTGRSVAVPSLTTVTRINLMRPLSEYLRLPVQKDPRGICICDDADYVRAYHAKYGA